MGKWGIGQVVEMALHQINPKRDRPLHLVFNINGCDPDIAPGTGTCSRGGLSYRQASYICQCCSMSTCLVSMDLCEINPKLDVASPARMHGDDPLISSNQRTMRLATELV